MVKFKAFECFSSTFQGKFNFQGLFKTVLYIQVLFKPVRTLNIEFKTYVYIQTNIFYAIFFISFKQLVIIVKYMNKVGSPRALTLMGLKRMGGVLSLRASRDLFLTTLE